jgi:hypothetical protein
MMRVFKEVAGYSLQEGFLQWFGGWQRCVVVCIKTGKDIPVTDRGDP